MINFHTRLAAIAAALVLVSQGEGAGTASLVQAMRLAREAAIATESKEYATAASKLEAAIELSPDIPQFWIDLATAQAAGGSPDEAIASLVRLSAFGLSWPIEQTAEFADLKSRKDFQAVIKTLAANAHPKGSGEIAFSLRDITGLIEGIAWRQSTDEFFFGDVHHRAVWARSKGRDGTLRRFTPENDELLGVYGLAVDESGGALWAATSAVPAMRGFTPEQAGQAALVEIDLETGAIRRSIPVPRAQGSEAVHSLSDVALGHDGTVYVVDSGMPILWRLVPGGSALQRVGEGSEFLALQGATVLPSGVVLLADQVGGLVSLDPTTGSSRRLVPPQDATLVEIKGVALAPGGEVLALQSGLRPSRVLAIRTDDTAETVDAVQVLESGHIAMGDPSRGCIGTGGDFFFIGNAGWSRFQGAESQPTPPRIVPIFRTKLPKKK